MTRSDFAIHASERDSVNYFDPDYKMSEQELIELLEISTKAPSSCNLQPWRFLILSRQEQKEKLFSISFFNQQVRDASAVIVVLGDLEAYKNAEVIYGEAVWEGFMTEDVKLKIVEQICKYFSSNPEFRKEETIRSTSMAAMQFMSAAKESGFDTCALFGYDAEQLIETYNIPAHYFPIMLISVGKAAKPAQLTTRLPVEQIIVWDQF